jgi:hypothetical protein
MSNPPRLIRADTVAAIASAIGALASAFIAAYALLFLSHQEDIAQKQLQATYLSNLFAKQVDAVAAVQTELSEFYEKTAILRRQPAAQDLTKFQTEVTANLDAINHAHNNLVRALNVLSLISPDSLSQLSDEISSVTYKTLRQAGEFAQGDPTPERFAAFSHQMADAFGRINGWYLKSHKCFKSILAQGKTIANEEIQSCADEPHGP